MSAEPIADYILTPHAAFEIRRRRLDLAVVHEVLARPEQRLLLTPGRVVLQSRVWLGSPATMYIVRVFVDVIREPAEVVTAYRSSKVGKYWR